MYLYNSQAPLYIEKRVGHMKRHGKAKAYENAAQNAPWKM